jgi:proteic killer suppression protein
LDILFASDALQRLCHDDEIALRTLDPAVVRRLRARLDDLNAAAFLGYARKLPGHFHPLAGNRDGQYAFSLCAGFELVIAPADRPLPRCADGTITLDKVSIITVISIGKVHD